MDSIFIGATLDAKFRDLELKTGREIWSASLPAPGMAVPMTYVDHGRQYVLIAAGGNALADTELNDAFVAFALPAASTGLADERLEFGTR